MKYVPQKIKMLCLFVVEIEWVMCHFEIILPTLDNLNWIGYRKSKTLLLNFVELEKTF